MTTAIVPISTRRRERPTRRMGLVRPDTDGAPVLLLGIAPSALEADARRAAARSGRALVTAPVIAPVAERPAAVLVAYEANHMAELCRAARMQPGMADIVLIVVAEELDDVVFEESFAAGADDCCSADEEALTCKLRAAEQIQKSPAVRRDEVVVVADSCATTRVLIACAFRSSGFGVRFVAHAGELGEASSGDCVAVVVVSADIAEMSARSEPIATCAHRLNSGAAWIVNTPPRAMSVTRERLGDAPVAVEIHDAFAGPSSLLFVANAMRSRHGVDLRRNPRMLYGTAVHYRQAGQRRGQVGFTYNVSGGGAYVRTLSPPDNGDKLWLELVPPRSNRLVHLEATVVWRRVSGSDGHAVVPPGFGVRITGGSAEDLDAYRAGCAAYMRDRGE